MWKVTRCLDLLSESLHRLGPARDDPYVTQCRWIAGPSFFSLCGAADRPLALVFRSVGDVVSPLWIGQIIVAANPRRCATDMTAPTAAPGLTNVRRYNKSVLRVALFAHSRTEFRSRVAYHRQRSCSGVGAEKPVALPPVCGLGGAPCSKISASASAVQRNASRSLELP